ncbi:tRNA pseudouridine(55) synthase TruB [Asticcacaulis sp. EMRT-3]|uniref:tRNA pseudouridine(55) synthase TruB n=1 Tax=Asticcacaulis sp. EMRT-3 TaxID=3040349 RepID=UPI0024AF5281|nr:tRNA pseudouridine(55) synthase TruB [Asticcacaulis sp. EMRT-3]MDI7775548.1 tRNA pseudouridine(55) synthase TruB [Asticcacaulis sp. EMRT-3]
MPRKKKGEPIHGWICFDKPLDMTSTSAVGKIRWLFQAQKAGHAGTLDPLATGILPIALGEATKTVPYLMEADKTYSFTIAFGTTTDSYDAEGRVTATSDARPTQEAIEAALPAFIGVVEQVPPAFSAIKVDGQRAYDLARAGVEVELKAREVEIFDLTLDAFHGDSADFTLHCGKGTYVRSVARDLCLELDVCGHVSRLRRESVGAFETKDAITLEKLEDLVHRGAHLEALLAVGTALDDIPALPVTQDEASRLKQGRDLALLPRQIDFISEALKARRAAGYEAFPDTVQAVLKGQVIALCEARGGLLHPARILNL